MTYALALCFLSFSLLYLKIYRWRTRISIADIRGPKPESFILGNLRQYFQSQAGQIDFEWQETYGDVIRFKGSFGQDRLLIADPKALQYIYHTAGYNFVKPNDRREVSRMLSGGGLLWAEGPDHRRHRKIMNPAFGSKESRALVPVFTSFAVKLSNKWKDLILTSSSQELVFDLATWLAKATLDAMGLAAFDYHFGTLDNAEDELGNAYANLCLDAFGSLTESDILKQSIVPYIPKQILHYITKNSPNPRLEQLRRTGAIATRVAKRLIDEKLKALESGKGNRDVMTLLVQANVSEDERNRMSEEEMIAQMRTLLLAGYETTATSLSWIMLEITRNTNVQTRLRNEIHEKEREIWARGDVECTANDFDSMPYLTAVIKEGLRYHPAAISSFKEATKDVVLPLHKPITTLSGNIITQLPMPKGTRVITSINGYNRHKDIFGSDAHVYDPDRWLTPGRITKAASVGTYANLITFAGGVRSCIGWRFAVLELQTFIVELISHFEFSMTPEAYRVRREACLVMAPTIEGQVDKGNQLPLMVKLSVRET